MCKNAWQNEKYDRFIADHYSKCAIHFDDSAGAMESTGVVSCFQGTAEVHKVRITNFIGDGNTTSHSGTPVKKLKCIGHVQKRCDTRLRNLKKTCKEKIMVKWERGICFAKATHKGFNKLQTCRYLANMPNRGC